MESKSESGCFEWIDGLLIQAMEAGDWLLIDNVNFCNPTVLDRLNSVLEPGGVLAVNERGMEADGQVKSVRPHPNFRIFFTMDPHNGEVSRAMRNRGIEICLLEHEVDSRDTLTLLNAAGIPGGEIPRAMIAFHVAAARGGALTGYNASRLSLRDVLQWARLAVDQAQRGVPAIRALFFAMEQVYIRPCCTGPNNSNINNTTTNSNTTTAGVRGGVRALMENFVRFFGCWEQPADVFQPAFRELGIWPARASGDLWRRNAAAGALILDAAPAESAFEATPAGASDWPALASPITFYKTMLHSGDNNATAARKKGAKMLVAVRSKHYMELSLRHLIETSTAEDADTRLAWLLSYAGNAGTTVDAAVHAMRALRESELLQKGSQAFAETCRALGITCDTLQHQQQQLPFALRTARCFRDLLVRLAGCDRAKMSLVRRCDALSRRVSLYVRIAMDDYAEAQACEAAEQLLGTSGGTTALAPLQRSILYAKNRIFLESIKSDWECHGWSFLAALTACLKSWLLAPESADAQKDAEDLRAVEEVLFAKEALVGTLCGSEHALTLDDVVWNWDSLFKALDHAGPLLPSNDALGYTHKKLCASLAALRVSPSRLWRTVRPRPYRHASLWDVQRNVTALGHEMELTSYASILPAFVTRAARPQFRKTLMDAAANFRWSMLLSKTSTAQEGADEEEGKRTVSEAVRLISEKMEEAMKKQQTTYEGEGEEEEEGRDNDEDVDRMDEAEESEQLVDDEGMPIVKSVFTSLWKVHNDQAGVSSLVDYSTVMREQEVLAYTLRGLLAAASSESGSTTEITRSVFDAHQRLVKQGADNIARSPLDYVPHILILWALSAAAEAAKESGQQQQQQNQQNQLQLMRQAKQLPGLETEALLNWHRRLWENTFDNTYFGARIVSRARVSCQTGPARIYQGLKSAIAYSLLSSWSTAPVQLYADKRSQIARVKAFFADEERLMFSSRALAELAAFVASFTQTVDSLAAGNSNVDVQCQCQRQRRAEIIELIFEGKRSAAGVAEELVAIFDEQLQGVVSATPSLEDVCKLLRRALQEVPAYVRGEKRTLGAAWALLGLAKVSLLVPPPTDPAAKSALKLRAAEEREGLTREEISVLRDIETVTTGNTTTEEIAALEGTVAAIEEQKRTLAAKAVERPKGNNNNSSGGGGIALSYANVHAEIARIVSMSFTVSRVLELIETLDNAPVTAAAAATSVSHEELSERQRALLKEEVWQETTGKALRALLDKYAEYPDVVQPLCLAAYETKYGLRLMSSVLAAANSASLLAMRNATVALSTYPRAFTDAEAAAAIRAVISPAVVSALHDAGVKTPWRVFSAALSMGTTYVAATAPPASSSEGLAATTGTGVEISPTMMDALNSVFDAYTKAWEKCEEKRRKREEEKAKEFETKTIVTEFIDEEKERQEEEEEIASLFPDYSSQFADLAPVKKSKKSGGDEIEVEEDDDDSDEEDYGFMKKNKNEEEAEKKKKKKSNGKKEEEISDKALKDVGTYVPTQEVETLRSAHLALFGGKKNKTKDEDERRKKALLDQYRAAAILVASISSTPEELDTKLTAIHTAVADLVIEQMDTRAASLNSAKRRNSGIAAVDIYKESCIEETVQAYEPLLRLERRLAELLREWPEHATLQSMMKIVRRILLMPLHAPLMKFVIGLECLLSQAQIWEQCAAKHVSLAGEMDTVSRLVARWRRLELMSWPLVLKTRERQHATSSGIWWFHLYSALIQARPATRDAVTATVKTVSDFLQTSSLGQFESRVEMVGAFAHHLALLYLRKDSSSSSNANGNVNGNGSVAKTLQTLARSVASLHALYAQFVEPCNERIANMRQKVEEELKEFIRLSSWERLEYYSLKEAAAKSHKKLTKLSKKYDKILRGPISDVLASIPHLSPDVIPDLIAIEKEEEEKDDTKEEKDGENSKDAKEKKEKKQKSKSKAVVSSPLQPSCAVSGKGVVGNDSHTAEAEPVESKNSPLSTAVVRPGTEDQRLKVANYIKTLESFSSKNLYKAFAEENTPIGYTTAEYAIDDLRAHGSTITAAGTKREDMSAKRLAFKMIEKTLKSLGISTEISKRCGEPTKGSYLMASPQAGPLLRRVFAGFLRGSSAHTVPSKGEHQLWGLGLASASQAEVLYFNVVAALQNFRQLHFKPSADLQPNEINLLAALSEHLAALTLIQRRTLHTSAGGLASCAAYCASFAALTRTDAPRTIPEQHRLRETWDILARVAQKAESGADDARRTLRAAALPEPGSALTELSSLAGRVLATAPAIAATPLLTAEHESQAKAYLENFAGALAALHTTVDSSQKVVLSALQATYAECADAITAARTTFEASRVNCDGNNSNNNNSSSHVSDDDKEVGAQFNKLFSIVVSHLLVPVQKMRDICEPLLKEECKVQFTDCHDMYKACLEATDCNTLVQCLSRLTAFVGEYCSRAGEARNEAVVTAMHALLGSLHGLLHQFLHSMGMVLALATCFHAELLKIFSTALGIFTTLYTRGWNMVVEDDSKQPPQEGKMEFADGTGMGEGEGEKDVSDQIEDSGQLNTGGNDEQPEDQQKQPEDPDKGFDMGDEDFDGSIQDVPQPTEEEKEKEEEEKDENEVDDDEKQMGQVDDDLSEKIDRKFWEGEDEEEKDLREELEKGDAPKTLDENEMEAQDDEDENSDKEDKKDKKDKKKEDRKSAPNPTEPPQEDDKDEENNEVENEEGEFIDEEEDEKESDPFNKNPENQPLDNEDEDEDENKDDGFAEDMELDKDSGDDNDDEDDEGNDEDGKKPEDLGNPDGSDLSEDELDENDFEQKDKGNDDLEEPESNDNNEENDDEDKNDDEINNNNENENDKTDQQEHNKEDQVFGVNVNISFIHSHTYKQTVLLLLLLIIIIFVYRIWMETRLSQIRWRWNQQRIRSSRPTTRTRTRTR